MDTPFPQQLALNIKTARETAKMTVRELEAVTGINRSTLSRMESNEQRVLVVDLVAIARATGADVHGLIPSQ